MGWGLWRGGVYSRAGRARGEINKQLTTQSWSVKTQRGERYWESLGKRRVKTGLKWGGTCPENHHQWWSDQPSDRLLGLLAWFQRQPCREPDVFSALFCSSVHLNTIVLLSDSDFGRRFCKISVKRPNIPVLNTTMYWMFGHSSNTS